MDWVCRVCWGSMSIDAVLTATSLDVYACALPLCYTPPVHVYCICVELGHPFRPYVSESNMFYLDRNLLHFIRIQGAQLYMTVCFLFLVPCKKWIVHCPVYWTSHFLQGTRKTRPCITGHPVSYTYRDDIFNIMQCIMNSV